MDPNQQLALYQAQFPGMMAANMGNAPAGTNQSAGTANALTKLVAALMQKRAMDQYRQKYGQQQQPTPVANAQPPVSPQGTTLSSPGGLGAGVPGVPDQ